MEQRLESSTLIALRELRGYEKERQLTERCKQEEDARQARERKERERQAEEAARERVLEKQLRTDLQRAEADRRMGEATQAMQALQALTSLPKAPTSPAPASPSRRGSWLAASGCTALLASALVLVIGLPRGSSTPSENSQRSSSCVAAVAPAVLPTTVAAVPATEVANTQSTESGPSDSGKHRPPTHHPHGPGVPHTIRKPTPPKPACDGTDPLCGLNISSIAPR